MRGFSYERGLHKHRSHDFPEIKVMGRIEHGVQSQSRARREQMHYRRCDLSWIVKRRKRRYRE